LYWFVLILCLFATLIITKVDIPVSITAPNIKKLIPSGLVGGLGRVGGGAGVLEGRGVGGGGHGTGVGHGGGHGGGHGVGVEQGAGVGCVLGDTLDDHVA